MRSVAAAAPPLMAVSAWLTGSGTLTRSSLEALLAECSRVAPDLEDCGALIGAGQPPFDGLPMDARAEAVLLFGACRGLAEGADCAHAIRVRREIRDLPLGIVDPKPTTMVEKQRTTFTAFVRKSNLTRAPGVDALPTVPSSGEAGQSPQPTTAVEYSRVMCFELKFAPKDFDVTGDVRQCPAYIDSGPIAFAPKWDVTPRRAGKLELELMRILTVGNETQSVPQEPDPIYIDVKAAPSLAERIKAWLTEWTGVAEAFRSFVLALEAIAATATFGFIWRFIRRRRAGQGN